MPIKVAMVSLGCPKNQIDAEQMLYSLQHHGIEIVNEEAQADAIIINTCGFIESAKAEAIENILEAARYKETGNLKALIVTGCLAERYKDDITEEIKEVDLVVGIGSNKNIAELVKKAVKGECENSYGPKEDLEMGKERILGSYPFSTYIKIAEGCNNCCTYCAIPKIRGKMRSRTIEDVVREARVLANKGVKELIVVAQDTTAYGVDIYGESKLPELLKELCKIDGIRWIRTLYTYPERITDELLEVINTEEKLVKYLDIPLQHVNGDILKSMNRRGDAKSLGELINRIRSNVKDVKIRTTFITGFPGETEEQFCELCEFVKQYKFDKLGCFTYSAEEGTIAAQMDNQIDEQTKQDRLDIIMREQMSVSEQKLIDMQGKTVTVLIEGYDSFIRCYYGRSEFDAPEIDGKVFFTTPKPLKIGDFVKVNIFDSIEYDLLGELVE